MTSSSDIIFLINSRFDAIERRFDAQDARIDEQISQVRGEIKELRNEMQEQNAQLHGEIEQVRNDVVKLRSDMEKEHMQLQFEIRVNANNIANLKDSIADLKDTITWGGTILTIVIMLVSFSGFIAAGFREFFSHRKEKKEHETHPTFEQTQNMIDDTIKKILQTKRAE